MFFSHFSFICSYNNMCDESVLTENASTNKRSQYY